MQKNTKKAKNAKIQKTQKKIKCKKNIFAGVVVVIALDLVLILQIFFHAKSGGCSFKID